MGGVLYAESPARLSRGRLLNTPENWKRWVQHPEQVDDKTAMPNAGVTETEARDIAAYLYTRR